MLLRIFVATITFLLLDAIWLGLVAKKLYANAIGHLMRVSNGSVQSLWSAAIVVYIAIIFGILTFVVPKANGSILLALLYGAIFGLIVYATYDFTNLATLSQWSLKISLIDTLWGAFLCGITSAITLYFSR